MRNYLEDWLSEEESVEVPAFARRVRTHRMKTQAEETEEGTGSAAQSGGRDIGRDRARTAWREKEAGAVPAGETAAESEERSALPAALAEIRRKRAAQGALYAAMGKVGRVERLALGEERGKAAPLTLPLRPQKAVTVERLDRAVQRDARRYDSGFSLY